MLRHLVCCAVLFAVLCAPAAAAPKLPLDDSGRWMVDARGRVVILHGQNLIATEAPWDALTAGFGRDDATLLTRAGFNTMRIGPLWVGAQPTPDGFDEAYLNSFAEQVRLLNRHGITPLVDFHQDGYGPAVGGTDGAPPWATETDGLPSCPSPYHALPCGKARAWDHFWANDKGLQDHYAAYVSRVIRSLRGLRVAGYDLMNEPEAGQVYATCFSDFGCPDFERRSLAPFYERVIRAAREADPTALLFYEPLLPFGVGAPSGLPDIKGDHLALSIHTYCARLGLPVLLPGETCEGRRDITLDRAGKLSADHPVLITEFGSTDFLPEQLGVMQAADRRRLGWIEWSYWNPSNLPSMMTVPDVALPPAGANVNAAKLALLTRVYPQAVAGHPDDWAYDELSRTFRMAWSSERVGGGAFGRCAITEIRVPRALYPDGYHAFGQGVDVVSAPGAGVLRLRARRPGRFSAVVRPGAGTPSRARSTCRRQRPASAATVQP